MENRLELPIYLFHQGTAERAYELLGAHPCTKGGKDGYIFRTWAPNAVNAYVTGEFCSWRAKDMPMKKISAQGIWELYIEGVKEFDMYRYILEDSYGELHEKSDPYGFHSETPPASSSRTCDISGYSWNDQNWMKYRQNLNPYKSPMNIYEVHAGSWRRYDDGNYFDYAKLAQELIPYVKTMGYTHIEFMPLAEHPFDGSWGYQVTGYYAPTSRFGTPKDFMKLVDLCHQNGIGIILDWVPGHFPKDSFGLIDFDGAPCYEYSDPLKNEQKEWGTMVFDWGRNEVRSFLISNAMYWFDKFHIDGLRVDAVASMLYLDYGRENGEWRPNRHGGRENLEAVEFFRDLNESVLTNYPGALMIAEESTSWPMVTKPPHTGGLGFNFKWNMGWMNDTLEYMKYDPMYRKYRHSALTFSMTYIYTENFLLPLSHDEVVHMKGSMINKMPGSYSNKFANLRTCYGYMMAHPGKKLLFMGGEFAQFSEWDYSRELDWNVLEHGSHASMQKYVADLNHFYLRSSEFWEEEEDWDGFRWINCNDSDQNIIIFSRLNSNKDEIIVICNFAPVKRTNYSIMVPKMGIYKEIFSSDDVTYGGEGNHVQSAQAEEDENGIFIKVDIPPLSTVFLKIS